MNKKVIIHGCLFGALLIYTWVAWTRFESLEREREKRGTDLWEEIEHVGSRAETASGMFHVAVPLLLTTIYGTALVLIYGLPALVEKVTDEMMGSTAEVDPDPLQEARDAVADGEYSDAIAIYHQHLLTHPGDRKALLEIVKLQRTHLESPALAANTLAEGLKDYDWEPDDRAFLMFRMAEIYEEDLDDRDKVIEVMKDVMEQLGGTGHAGNAAHKLFQLKA